MHSILIADDDKYIRDLVSSLLMNDGYFVKSATTAKDVISALQSGNFDAMILDAHIEGLGSLQLLALVKQINPRLPIIVITGDNSIELERGIRSLGVYYYLIKPFKVIELRDVVESAVNRSGTETDRLAK